MNAAERYVQELGAALRVSRRRRARIVSEVRDHLDDALADETGDDARRWDAVEARFGSPAAVASACNADAGRRAAHAGLLLILGVGAVVASGLVAGARLSAWSRGTVPGGWLVVQQVAFFAAVLAAEVAIVAIARGALRCTALRWSSPWSRADRTLVHSCGVVALVGWSVAAVGWSVSFVVARVADPRVDDAGFVGVALMALAAGAGCSIWRRLRFNLADAPAVAPTSSVAAVVERMVLHAVRRRPVTSCLAVAITTSVWVAASAETATWVAAWPWAVAQLVAVVVGFVTLAPRLELRRLAS